MKREEPNLIVAAKILASTLLVTVGAVGLYFPSEVPKPVPSAVLILGLWLMVGAWTGYTVSARLHALSKAWDNFLDGQSANESSSDADRHPAEAKTTP